MGVLVCFSFVLGLFFLFFKHDYDFLKMIISLSMRLSGILKNGASDLQLLDPCCLDFFDALKMRVI